MAIELPVEGQVPEGFIFVPGGRFLFGTSHDEFLRRFFSTVPQHAVELGPYMIARTEVTFAQYIEYLDTLSAEARSKRSAESKATGPLMAGVSLRELSPKRWELSFAINADVKYVVAQGESIVFQGRTTNISQDWLQLPATGLSWKDAEDYIRWLDETGRVPGLDFARSGSGSALLAGLMSGSIPTPIGFGRPMRTLT